MFNFNSIKPSASSAQVDNLRPKTFADFKGQRQAIEYLRAQRDAFINHGEFVPHMLILGFSGGGKTTLSRILAEEMGVPFVEVFCPDIKSWDDLKKIISKMPANGVLFLDEIHVLSTKIQEAMYKFLEDFQIEVPDRYGRLFPEKVAPFTVLGATTDAGKLIVPFRRRFTGDTTLVPYTHEELGAIIVSRAKAIFDINLCPTLAFGLARISQGTAGNAINLLKTVVRMAQAENTAKLTGAEITNTLVSISLKRMGRDPWVGLDRSQRKYLVALAGAGGRGLSAASLATMSNEKVSTIETMVEPFLLQRSGLPCFSDADRQYHRLGGAFVTRSRSGRCPTILTFKYLEMVQKLQDDDPDWFAGENLQFNSEVEDEPINNDTADQLAIFARA